MRIATGQIEERTATSESKDYARKGGLAVKMAPAMTAGVSKTLWSMDNIVALIDAAAPKPERPQTYRKRESTT
jgi:hypothetical protein